MARKITNPNLNLREVVAKNKWGRPMFRCINWDCDNLCYGRVCRDCMCKGSRKQLSRCSTPLEKRKFKGVI